MGTAGVGCMTRAVHYRDRNDFLQDQVPGSFWISGPEEKGEQSFIFFCPCGCGDKSVLKIGNGFKPKHGPSWCWNGSTAAAEIAPSVNWQGHWHGWLQAGVWRAC